MALTPRRGNEKIGVQHLFECVKQSKRYALTYY